MNTAGSSLKQSVRETVNTRVNVRRSRKESVEIEENEYYNILAESKLSLKEKSQQIAKKLEFTNSKVQDRENVKMFDAFKEYLQAQSEELSKTRIRLASTDTYATLQKVVGQFNDRLNDFKLKIKPLTDITDALYNLRKTGETRSVLEKIQKDRILAKEQAERLTKLFEEKNELLNKVDEITEENYVLQNDRGFFGLGAVKPESKSKIQYNEARIEKFNSEVQARNDAIEQLNAEIAERESLINDSFEATQLRELLNLNTDEHKQRQVEMIQAAVEFVEEAKERFGEIRSHLGDMVNQIEELKDNNDNMLQVYAVLNDATKNVEDSHKKKREDLLSKPEPEDELEKLKWNEEKRNLDEHIEMVSNSSIDTVQTFGSLTKEAITIGNMQSATKRQEEGARALHSRGVAQVASQLSVVVNAVNSAAINESTAMASNTLQEMASVTDEISKKEAISLAIGRGDINSDLVSTLQTLADFGAVQQEASEITNSIMQDIRDNMEEIKDLSKEVQKDTDEFTAVTANVITKSSKSGGKKNPKSIFGK